MACKYSSIVRWNASSVFRLMGIDKRAPTSSIVARALTGTVVGRYERESQVSKRMRKIYNNQPSVIGS